MEDGTPLFTMVKSQTLGDAPDSLSDKSRGLLETLSMLCSFYSADDLASFLFSSIFSELTRQGDAWLEFEIGLYVDHTKTLNLISSKNEILFADNAASGVFTENIHRCTDQQDTSIQIMKWYSLVHSPESRFE